MLKKTVPSNIFSALNCHKWKSNLWSYYSWGVRNHTENPLHLMCQQQARKVAGPPQSWFLSWVSEGGGSRSEWSKIKSVIIFWNLDETPHSDGFQARPSDWNVFHSSQWNMKTFIFKRLQNWRWKLVAGNPRSICILISASSGHCAESPCWKCPFMLLFPKVSVFYFSFLFSVQSIPMGLS